jgi:hypothetical protein
MQTIDWKRTGKDRATGSWRVRKDMLPETGFKSNHAVLKLYVYTTKHQKKLLHFFKVLASKAMTNFGFMDAFTCHYLPFGNENNFIAFGNLMTLTTHVLRHWLPDMPWAAVFGPDYIDLFGKECLLATPAYKTELLADDVVFIQLTPDLNDLWDNFDEVMAAREAAKRHLGYECFWQKELDYDRRKHPENAGKIFKVPEFHFIDDGILPSWAEEAGAKVRFVGQGYKYIDENGELTNIAPPHVAENMKQQLRNSILKQGGSIAIFDPETKTLTPVTKK